jgi:hypothetical protein
MLKHVLCLSALAAAALALAACSGPNVPVTDWSRPFQPLTGKPPVFLHNLAIANPPYPRDRYANYEDEPTRFIFRPRNVTYEETDNGTGNADQGADYGAYGDYGAYDMGGGGGE